MVTQVGPGMGAAANAGFAIGFVLVWGIAMCVGLATWIVFLIAAWRMMRAHESLAESARIATELMQQKRSAGA